jgi:hypothetical protein
MWVTPKLITMYQHCFVSFLLVLFGVRIGKADLMPPSTFVEGHACVSPIAESPCSGVAITLGSPTTESISYANTVAVGVGSTYQITADGVSSYGSLGSSSSTTLVDPEALSHTDQNLSALMVEVLTITAGSATGTGYLDVVATVSGSQFSSGSGLAAEVVSVGTAFGSPDEKDVRNTIGSVAFQPLTFTFGVPFNLIFALTTATAEGPGNGSGTADFFNTAVLSGLDVFDSNMNPVLNPTFTSGSGTEYTVNGVVPEPSAFTLLATALLGLALASRFPWIHVRHKLAEIPFRCHREP